jgi:dephospho-CoA kinase
MLIGLGHIARTGKSTAAHILEDEGFTVLSFAEPVRQMAYDSMPLVRYQVDRNGWIDAKRVPEIRAALQNLGASIRKNLPDALIDAVFNEMHYGQDYVIDDVRFLDEAQIIQRCGGHVFRVDRPGVSPVNYHESEIQLAGWSGGDGVIDNNGSVDDLAVKLKQVVSDIRRVGG